jgi:hypothetical protein
VLLRADSAYSGHAVVGAALKSGAEVSITVRLDKKVEAAIAAIDPEGWTRTAYPRAVFDEPSGHWISVAEVAEIDFTAFTSKKKLDQVPGRLVVRRIPDLNTAPGQGTLFEQWRYHTFFTTTTREVADTVTVDKVHRGHAARSGLLGQPTPQPSHPETTFHHDPAHRWIRAFAIACRQKAIVVGV